MRVDLRGSHIGVSEQLLNSSEIGSSFEEMSGVRMPQRVRMQHTPVREWMALEDSPDIAWRHAAPAGIHEERLRRSAGRKGRAPCLHLASCLHISPDGPERRFPEREPPDLGTLAEHRDGGVAIVHVGDVEPAALADAQTRAVQELEDRTVT